MASKKEIGDWGERIGLSYIKPFFPEVVLCKNPIQKHIDSYKPLVQWKARSWEEFGKGNPNGGWVPTLEEINRALTEYPDYLVMFLYHDGKQKQDIKLKPLNLVYGVIFTAKEAMLGGVYWNPAIMNGESVKKIWLNKMHENPKNWPKVLFFDNQDEFNEKFPSWKKERDF